MRRNIVAGFVAGLVGLTGIAFWIQQAQADPSAARSQSISGKVVRLIDDDDFILNDGTREIRVDADAQAIDMISPGQQIILTGTFDDDRREFDAYTIKLPNGNEVALDDD